MEKESEFYKGEYTDKEVDEIADEVAKKARKRKAAQNAIARSDVTDRLAKIVRVEESGKIDLENSSQAVASSPSKLDKGDLSGKLRAKQEEIERRKKETEKLYG